VARRVSKAGSSRARVRAVDLLGDEGELGPGQDPALDRLAGGEVDEGAGEHVVAVGVDVHVGPA